MLIGTKGGFFVLCYGTENVLGPPLNNKNPPSARHTGGGKGESVF